MRYESIAVTGREHLDHDLRGLEPHLSLAFQGVGDDEELNVRLRLFFEKTKNEA